MTIPVLDPNNISDTWLTLTQRVNTMIGRFNDLNTFDDIVITGGSITGVSLEIPSAEIESTTITNSLVLTGASITLDNDSISGDKISGGTIDNVTIELAGSPSANNHATNKQYVDGLISTVSSSISALSSSIFSFKTIAVPTQTSVVATGLDTTLNLNAGTGITILTNNTSKTITLGISDGTRADISVSGSNWTIVNNAVTTTKINDSAVTTTKINDSAVTTTKINDSAVTTAKLNTKSVTVEKVNSASSDAGLAIVSDGAGGAVWGQTGLLVQSIYVSDNSLISGAEIIPIDNSIPQSYEGKQVISADITPTSASNRIRVRLSGFVGGGNNSRDGTFAFFRNNETNAISAHFIKMNLNEEDAAHFYCEFEFTAATTSAMTIKARFGKDGTGTWNINGVSTARVYGGVASLKMIVEEIKA